MMKLKIAHLYPSLMNMYGDRGNIMAIQYRAGLRGIKTQVTALEPGDTIPKKTFNMYFFGGGQDAEQDLIYKDCIEIKGRRLIAEIEGGAAFLAVCGGYQLLGTSYITPSGKEIPGIGALDIHTTAGGFRATGNVLVEARLGGEEYTIAGFENHGGRTWLGSSVAPLGKVISGSGNNGQDGTEGVVYKNTIGTYMHGPVLPKNYRLTDYLIQQGMRRMYPDFLLADAPADAETMAFEEAASLCRSEKNTQDKRPR